MIISPGTAASAGLIAQLSGDSGGDGATCLSADGYRIYDPLFRERFGCRRIVHDL